MRAKTLITLVLFLILASQVSTQPPASQGSAEQIIARVNKNLQQIKDATADITLDYNLCFFGCSGLRRMKGRGYYKYPDRIKSELEGITYFARGNRIRKIDEKGKMFYVKLINSLDFAPGFHAGLIPYNFRLRLLKDSKDEILIEGIPKPGTLKHITKVIFHIDPREYLLRKMDLTLSNRSLSGSIKIDYQKIQSYWVPVGFHGTTAIEIRDNMLVGMGIRLKGENFKINTGLPNKLFDPGF
jgi:outer membrane lipoprotein-sorting protein